MSVNPKTSNGGASTQKRAIIHTRVSTDGQTDNTSHASQLAAGLKRASELGADVVATFQEEISGALYLARPDIQTSLAMIEAGQADMLIFSKLDRAGRDVDALRSVKRRVEQAGGQLVFADGMQFENNPNGNFLFTILAGAAENERAVIRDRMVSGLVATAQAGIMPARTNPPYGYYIPKHADITRGTYKPEDAGKYFIVEEQARHVRTMFEMYDRGHSLSEIVEHLNTKGVPTPRGARQWVATAVRSILLSTAYKGKPAYRKTKRKVDETRRSLHGFSKIAYEEKRPESEWIYLDAPPIVAPELWQSVRDKLERSREERSGRSDRKYLLSGLLWCPKCGSRLYARAGALKLKAGKKRYPIYLCKDAMPRHGSRCEKRYYAAAALEKLVIEAVLHFWENPELVTRAVQEYSAWQATSRDTAQGEADLKRLRREITALEKRERAAAESKIEAKTTGASTEIFDRILAEIAKESSRIISRIEEIERKRESLQAPSLQMPDMPIEDLRAVLESENIPGPQKHRVLWQITERIYPGGARYHPKVEIVLRTSPQSFGDKVLLILTNDNGTISVRMASPDPFPQPPARRNTYRATR